MSNPIVKSVCRAMERIAPLRLAEKWDNVSRVLNSFLPLRHGQDFSALLPAPPASLEARDVVSSRPPSLSSHAPVSCYFIDHPIQVGLLLGS